MRGRKTIRAVKNGPICLDGRGAWSYRAYMQALILLQRYNFIRYHQTFSRCLPENSYFCSIANNFECTANRCRLVVICLKTRTFAVSQTTEIDVTKPRGGLWFAWKLVLLQYRKQQQDPIAFFNACCDLLENSYFCSIANNVLLKRLLRLLLWFAWKLVLLQYRKQPGFKPQFEDDGCDLLENSYFCSIANNR